MGISTTLLERAGLRVDPEEFDRLVADALAEVIPLRPSPDSTAELPDAEMAVLAAGGLRFDPPPTGHQQPLVRSAALYAALLGSSLSVAQAAAHLRVAESRVRQRLGERTLYGIKTPGGWRLPRFQMAGGGPAEQDAAGRGLVPGIERVLPRLPRDLHPLAVMGWFTMPNPDLTIGQDDEPVSPLDWLNAGLPPAVVADLAENAGAFD